MDGAASDPIAGHPPPARRPRAPWVAALAWARDIAIASAICAFLILFVYQPFRVEGSSMSPTLRDEEMILVNKFVYRFEDVHRGDVVVFHGPGESRRTLVKRVVGLPGDCVEIRDGAVFVNGTPLTEPYLVPEYCDRDSFGAVNVPDGMLYVLGDHRNVSSDSRVFHSIPIASVSGKAVLRYWPPDRIERLGRDR